MTTTAHLSTPAILLGLLALAGAAVLPASQGFDPRRLERELAARGLDAGAVEVPFALTEEMRQWAREIAPRRLGAELKLSRLVTGLLGQKELALEYSWGYTGTAREVFEDRRANCLAFTNLFLGMAREVGVPVYFLAVESETYRRQGSFVVVSDHMAVGFGTGSTVTMIDFSESPSEVLPKVRRISDVTAIAMFYSNRGAEELQQGRIEDAREWLRTAVVLDPELATAWVNLGVALRRAGEIESAEAAYRQALEIDPRTYTAFQNLSTLLRLGGRRDEAVELETTLKKAATRNPFTYLALGDISLRNGRLDEARRLYRRAANLDHDDPEAYAALGQLAFVSGDLGTARKMLKKAQKLDEENRRTSRLATMIAIR
jgi:Flp pilus assembly protein TadD